MGSMESEARPFLDKADAARDEALKSVDALLDEIAKQSPTSDDVVKHAGQAWLQSMKAWANAAQVPTAVAKALRD